MALFASEWTSIEIETAIRKEINRIRHILMCSFLIKFIKQIYDSLLAIIRKKFPELR